MRSLILTALYLTKDTIHRWLTRISSPLARVLVVYFLSICALAALGSYAIATKVVRDRIKRQGGDLVVLTVSRVSSDPIYLPTEKEISELLDADSFALRTLGYAQNEKKTMVPIVSYDFRRSGQFLPLLASSGRPTYLIPQTGDTPVPGPGSVSYDGSDHEVFIRRLPEGHLLMRLQENGCVVVQPDNLPPSLERVGMGMTQLIMRVRNLENSESIRRTEEYFRRFMRLEHLSGSVISASRLLNEMDELMGKQTQCRIAYCAGITGIVGILLTALAGMEYRQNEYIYTLMKSFGIHPAMLVGAFVMENLVIVGASFAAALATFMHFQAPIVKDILKLGHYSLSLEEIAPEIRLITFTLLGCILLSCFPIIVAANRAIGRVLK